ATGAGSASITVNIDASNAVSATFYVQALASSGAVGYTAVSSHYGSASGTITLARAGLAIQSPGGSGAAQFDTPLGAGAATLDVFTGALDAGGAFADPQLVAGGGSVSVVVISSNTSAGTITASPVAIAGGSGSAETSFQPVSPGTAIITASSTGFNSAQVTANVVNAIQPLLFTGGDLVIGQFLASPWAVTLPRAAGPGGVQVSVAVDSSSVFVSATATGAGSGTLTLGIPEGSQSAAFYVQALGDSGGATVSATASGFASTSEPIQLAPTGIALYPSAISGSAGQTAPLNVIAAGLEST